MSLHPRQSATVDEIAAEYAKGRLLLVGTTDLDALEPVIWNMTALAASKHPQALDLFRRIMLASASIPGAFPPVMLDVEVDGVRHQEMHVDGGTIAQVFHFSVYSAAQLAVPRSVRSTSSAMRGWMLTGPALSAGHCPLRHEPSAR
jgi:predicted acylesterase/phospholipase RssA